MCTTLVPIWDIIPISESIRDESAKHASEALDYFDLADMGSLPNAARLGKAALNTATHLHNVAMWLDSQATAG